MNGRFTTPLILIGCFAAGLLVAGKPREATEAGAQSPTGASRSTAISAPGPVGATGTLTDFSRIAERTIPAVVNVSSSSAATATSSPTITSSPATLDACGSSSST